MIEVNNKLAKGIERTNKQFLCYILENNKVTTYRFTNDLYTTRIKLKGCKFIVLSCAKLTKSKNYLNLN